jgi:hypothetical protein
MAVEAGVVGGSGGQRPGPGNRTPAADLDAAELWEAAQAALARLNRLSEALGEACSELQRRTERSAEASQGWSTCLAFIGRVLHKEGADVRSSALSLLDEHSRKIVRVLLKEMDGLPIGAACRSADPGAGDRA